MKEGSNFLQKASVGVIFIAWPWILSLHLVVFLLKLLMASQIIQVYMVAVYQFRHLITWLFLTVITGSCGLFHKMNLLKTRSLHRTRVTKIFLLNNKDAPDRSGASFIECYLSVFPNYFSVAAKVLSNASPLNSLAMIFPLGSINTLNGMPSKPYRPTAALLHCLRSLICCQVK